MTNLELKNHPVWQDLTEILENIDANKLVTEHLELCDYKISGYWDENDEFYEEVLLPRSLAAKLISSSIGMTGRKRWIQMKFFLEINLINFEVQHIANNSRKIGELILIYDENLEFVDENWQININEISRGII
ncbi:hypothetical protein NIES2119_24810 [[Phormidium ambiguum] IAM M-71]|uniref:Uncharacterized protein n=1 Tax=[Phormidium ambiguum] IAM M-71 TaxID=454136 RepID=A0A1U7I947_9CYAN|nr:hypothetical protein [Phormidium ambiguum]OKH32959.1 hypothetical protein NIES2119_24810 [Phormidium ambiguum IAM M-71]